MKKYRENKTIFFIYLFIIKRQNQVRFVYHQKINSSLDTRKYVYLFLKNEYMYNVQPYMKSF